jgi:chromate transporter
MLGFTAFGGPAAHIAMMERELVHHRRWLDRQHFLDLIGAINFIPGPNSTELAIALGRLRGGGRGLVIAGACFILPAVLIILPIAWVYVDYNQRPQVAGLFRGIGAAVVAIVAVAAWRFARTAIRNRLAIIIALFAAGGQAFSHHYQWAMGDLAILALAAIAGMMRGAYLSKAATKNYTIVPYPIAILLAAFGSASGPIVMAMLFLKIGITLFGSGYVLVTYLQTSFVDQRHWLTSRQLLDAVAVGQVTPGPLLTTATFVGFVLGHNQFGGGLMTEVGCALLATAAIFAPAFLLIALMGSWLERLRRNPQARAALDAMNAAVAGLIAATCVIMAQQALQPPHAWAIAAMMIACLVVTMSNINPTWVIAAAGLFGWIYLR